jgi:hypothetical protein
MRVFIVSRIIVLAPALINELAHDVGGNGIPAGAIRALREGIAHGVRSGTEEHAVEIGADGRSGAAVILRAQLGEVLVRVDDFDNLAGVGIAPGTVGSASNKPGIFERLHSDRAVFDLAIDDIQKRHRAFVCRLILLGIPVLPADEIIDPVAEFIRQPPEVGRVFCLAAKGFEPPLHVVKEVAVRLLHGDAIFRDGLATVLQRDMFGHVSTLWDSRLFPDAGTVEHQSSKAAPFVPTH